MITIYILIILLLLLIFIPVRFKIKYEVVNNFDKKNQNEKLHTNNYVIIYILYFIKIKKIEIKNKENVKLKENEKSSFNLIIDVIVQFFLELLNMKKMDEALITKKELTSISKNLYFEKMNLNLGINLNDVILNAYVISLLNSVINMYFAKNSNKINFRKTEYLTYISNKILNIKIESIIRVNFVNTIIITIKILLRYRKVVKKNGKTTSNRKFNDDSYDFA